MDVINLISNRLNGKDFYLNSYYKFEKYSALKNLWKQTHKEELLDFGIGENMTLPPMSSLDTLSNNLFVKENNIYSDNGIDEFKIAMAKYMKDYFNVFIEQPLIQINHCIGAKSALTIIPIAFVSDQDIIISTTPGYEVLANMASWLNGKVYKIPLLKENDFLPDLDSIPTEILEKCKLFSINYPNNPTASNATKAFYEKLVSLALKYNFIIVNDAAYSLFTYKSKPLSIFSVKDAFKCAIEIHTLSKSFNMTGMRIGFVVGNPTLIDIFKKVKDNIDSGQYIPIQKAAIDCVNNCKNYVDRLKSKYYQRMKNVSKIFSKYNMPLNVSNSTFYLYLKVPELFKTADEFSRYLLDNCGIFTIPWDEVEPYVRLSMTFLCDKEKNFYKLLDERLSRIKKLS